MFARLNAKAAVIVAVTLILVGVYLRFPVNEVKIHGNITNFPQVLGAWQSGGQMLSIEDLSALGADVNLARQYQSSDGNPIELYLAYFESQAQAKELVGDRTERFVIGESAAEDSRIPLGGLDVRRIVQRRGNAYRLVFCWYEIDGDSRADARWVVLRTIQNGVLHRRTNGAIVMVAMEYDSSEQLPHRSEQLGAFVHAALPDIKAFLSEK